MSIFKDNKQEFLNQVFKDEIERNNHEEAYIDFIEQIEIDKNRDLRDFSRDEIKEITGRKYKNNNGYGSDIESFVFQYLDFVKKQVKLQRQIKNKTEAEQKRKSKEKKLNEMKNYIKQKEVYIEEFHFDKEDITKKTYMDCYRSSIAPLEVYKKKDLFDFIEDDIVELFASMPTTSANVKRMVWNFINSYFIWADSKGILQTHHNPLQSLDKDELFELNLKAFRKQFLSMDETYELCEKAIKNGSNYQDCIIVLLARYGVNGKALSEILSLKETDVDAEKKKLRIVDDTTGEIRELDIDDRLLKWIEKAVDCYVYDYKRIKTTIKQDGDESVDYLDNEKDFYDKGYIVKVQNEDDEIEKKDNAYRRIGKMCECAGVRPISIKNLISSKQFDDLDKIREIKGDKMEVQDVIYINSLYYPNASASAYWTLKEKYENYRGVTIDNKQKIGMKPKAKINIDDLEN